MSHEEKNTVAAFLSSLAIAAIFGSMLWSRTASGQFDGPAGLAAWGQTVLWMIPAGVVATIVLTIGVNIITAISAREPNPSFVVDERDHEIGTFGMKVAMIVASTGFIGAVVALALGWSALAGLNLILVSFVAADLCSNVAKMIAYRGGF